MPPKQSKAQELVKGAGAGLVDPPKAATRLPPRGAAKQPPKEPTKEPPKDATKLPPPKEAAKELPKDPPKAPPKDAAQALPPPNVPHPMAGRRDTLLSVPSGEGTSSNFRSRFMSVTLEDLNMQAELADQWETEAPQRKLSASFNVVEATELSGRIMDAFRRLIFLMRIFIRFPFLYEYSPIDGSYQFTVMANGSFQVSAGFVTTIIFYILFILMIANCVGIFLDFPAQNGVGDRNATLVRSAELYIFRRSLGPVLYLLTSMLHACIALLNFHIKREFAAKCLTFWTQAAGMLRTDLALGLKRYFNFLLGGYTLCIGFMVLFTFMQIIPVATGAPGMLAILFTRCFAPHLFFTGEFWIVRSISAVIMFYMLVCSKVHILLFLFQAKLLSNAFRVWNERLDRVLHRGENDASEKEKSVHRTGFLNLFKDHVCLLDMMEGTDTLFSNAIESFYATQFISVCFEVYYFTRTLSARDEFFGARLMDSVYIFFYMIQSIVILCTVTYSAAQVGQFAMDGLEILRHKGMMGRRTDEELYFMLTMYMSFNAHFDTALSGGKYFSIDKSFLVTVSGTIFTYFVILLQFTPPLAYKANTPAEQAYMTPEFIKEFLDTFEGSWDVVSYIVDNGTVTNGNPWNFK